MLTIALLYGWHALYFICVTNVTLKFGNIPEIDYEIFSTFILSFPVIQEGQLSISGERMCTNTG